MKDFKFYLQKVQIISESKQFDDIKSIIDDLKIAIGINDLEQIESAINKFNNEIYNDLNEEEYQEITKILETVSKMIKSSVLTKDTKEYILNLYKSLEINIRDAQYYDNSPFKNDPITDEIFKDLNSDMIKKNKVIYAFYIDSDKDELITTDSYLGEEKTYIFNDKDTKQIKKEIKIQDFNFKMMFDIMSKNIKINLNVNAPLNTDYSLKINNKSKEKKSGNFNENINLSGDDDYVLMIERKGKEKITIEFVLRIYS